MNDLLVYQHLVVEGRVISLVSSLELKVDDWQITEVVKWKCSARQHDSNWVRAYAPGLKNWFEKKQVFAFLKKSLW